MLCAAIKSAGKKRESKLFLWWNVDFKFNVEICFRKKAKALVPPLKKQYRDAKFPWMCTCLKYCRAIIIGQV